MNVIAKMDDPSALIGEVVAARLRPVIRRAGGSRVVYAMVDLGKDVTCAVAEAVSEISVSDHNRSDDHNRIEVGIHPELATDWLSSRLRSDEAATWYRNHSGEGVVATLFSVPGRQMEEVLQSLGGVQRINHAWIMDPTKADVWADHALPTYGGTSVAGELTSVLRGLMESGVLASSSMLAEFCVSLRDSMTGARGMSLRRAINHGLPTLQLPRDCLADNELDSLMSSPAASFRGCRDEFRPYLYLRSRRGDDRRKKEMWDAIERLSGDGDLTNETAAALRGLVGDRELTANRWRPSQSAVARVPWPQVRKFFEDKKKTGPANLGASTIKFLDDNHPETLQEDERSILARLHGGRVRPTPELRRIYFRHRERLRDLVSLYKKWQRLVFQKPIKQDDDLLLGLVDLTERAFGSVDNPSDRTLIIQLRDGDKKPFWTEHKNSDLCHFLRDRYRGLDQLLGPRVKLKFGRCWTGEWEDEVRSDSATRKGRRRREFEFEAYLVEQASADQAGNSGPAPSAALGHPAAQMIWSPDPQSFVAAMSSDLRRVLPDEAESAHLLRSRVAAAQGSSGSKLDRPTLSQVASVTDSYGYSEGALANAGEDPADREWNCIDQSWPDALRKHSEGVLNEDRQGEALRLFESFRTSYTAAIKALVAPGGSGLADPSLVEQSERYGALLVWLREHARSAVLVQQVWEPLLEIGTATVRGVTPAMIVTPWHPLRLLELTVKAHQAARAMQRILSSPSIEGVQVEDYANDRRRSLQDSYYANTALVRTEDGQSHLVVETEQRGGYSLLQPAATEYGADAGAPPVEKPVKDVVGRFGKIAEHYLALNPHDQANFSVVLFDSESEELPVMVAKHLAQLIQRHSDLRCDLTVTHSDPTKLRRIYEHQNRRIGRELEASLTSEAARTFLSRLRIGISAQDALGGKHQHDLLLLHDVLAPHARVCWHEVHQPDARESPLSHAPNDTTRRKSLKRGSLSTSVYLTSPLQTTCTQSYLDVLHDANHRKPSATAKHFVPAQEVEFASVEIKQRLEEAHSIASWVVTYDRIADRRTIGCEDDKLRILRYFSTPRSTHNVIVSTEMLRNDLRSRLEEDVRRMLSGRSPEEMDAIVDAIHERATGLSGGIFMRGSLWDNYARELIGVIVTQRELELLLRQGVQDHRTAMSFLDEIQDWLDLEGELADILAVDLQVDSSGGQRIHLVIAEAKCIGKAGASKSKKKSWDQLEETYTAIKGRFQRGEGTVDNTIWHKRLADLLVEHMEPWADLDRLGGWSFDEWIDNIRSCNVPVEVSAHSVVTVHDQAGSDQDLDLQIADPNCDRIKRRKIAQWTLGADLIAKSLRGILHDQAGCLLHIPPSWPSTQSEDGPDPTGVGGDSGSDVESVGVAPIDTDPTEAGAQASGETDGRGQGATPELTCHGHEEPSSVPIGWKDEIHRAVSEIQPPADQDSDLNWLQDQTHRLRVALQEEGFDAPVEAIRLTPNAGLVRVGGRSVNINWMIRHKVDRMLVRHSIEIVRVTPRPGYFVVAIRRPNRKILLLADAWLRRMLSADSPTHNLAPVIGEKEDDGKLFYLPLAGDFAAQPSAAPHTLVSGTTGSGKGILAANLILDICAFNDPRCVEVHLIDPKQGVDYPWAPNLPHLQGGIVAERDAAIKLLEDLVAKMESRYSRIALAKCANIAEFNRTCEPSKRIPYVFIFFDEVANWMQDDEFKKKVEGILNSIATKARAAGLHLVMIYQRADKDVMTMQLRTNLGNKLILRLADQGSSKIALGSKGAEELMGKGHIIADLGSGERIYGQVPYIDSSDSRTLAAAIRQAWSADRA